MKFLEYLGILIFLFSCLQCKSQSSCLNQQGIRKINGGVKTLQQTAYRAEIRSGGVVKEKHNDRWDDNVRESYNMEGYCISHENCDTLGKVIGKELYTFNSMSCLIEYKKINDSLVIGIAKYSYSKDGQFAVIEEYNENGKLIKTNKLRLNAQGLPGEEFIYNAQGVLEYKSGLTEYNEKGEIMKIEIYDKTGKVIQRIAYLYDDNANTVQTTYTSINEPEYSYIKTDKKNKNNDIIEQKFVGTNTQSITKYDYEYDVKGNWVKKTEFIDYYKDKFSSVFVTERVITYY